MAAMVLGQKAEELVMRQMQMAAAEAQQLTAKHVLYGGAMGGSAAMPPAPPHPQALPPAASHKAANSSGAATRNEPSAVSGRRSDAPAGNAKRSAGPAVAIRRADAAPYATPPTGPRLCTKLPGALSSSSTAPALLPPPPASLLPRQTPGAAGPGTRSRPAEPRAKLAAIAGGAM